MADQPFRLGEWWSNLGGGEPLRLPIGGGGHNLNLEGPTQRDAHKFMDRLRRTAANIRVTEENALKLPVYSGGTGLISGAIRKLPLRVVRESDRTPVRRPPPWATSVPCPGMSAAAFKGLYARSQLIPGFTVFRILSWVDGRPWRLEPLPTRWTYLNSLGQTRRREAVHSSRRGGISVRLREWLGPGDDMPREDRCLIVEADPDGTLTGRSTLEDLTPTIALGLAMIEHSALIFTYPSAQYLLSLKESAGESVEKFGEDLIEQMQREEKRHHAIVSDVMVEATRIGLTPEEAQLIPAKDHIVQEVCRRLWIAPMLLALPITTWGTGVRDARRGLHELTVPSWTAAMASGLDRCLPAGQKTVFDTTEALKGDLATEATAITKLVGGPTWTRNEGRIRQNLPVVEGGDDFLDPGAPPSKVEVVESPETDGSS